MAEGSLFTFDRETILVFGGVDPQMQYGKQRNTGKDVYQYSSERNTWLFVGEMPQPRHHHNAVFFRGRVYLAGMFT